MDHSKLLAGDRSIHPLNKSTMQLKLAFIFAALSVTLTSAEQGGICEPAANCITGGGPLCCETLTKASSSIADPILASHDIILPTLDINIALSCTNIVPGSSTCDGQAVCCELNNFDGIIAIGCNPVQL
ncbi:hypothetical protein GYMLUDRAFT_42203 [Collybiopsis luxurians FD-317 M1]|uniref:Hydrophobin n=1 Tax=Collybiopsis luxurians FD-317 M1 TaxID=944289 RepID=A0A0D0C2C8_9AGAR|nr:hypothetical protein GYMLUDRAFT_42203 [Collybiopsis luxurians FD-317 M1]